ncbi:MAG: alpha/beta hydrolase [Dehalococcoidia bacterium]
MTAPRQHVYTSQRLRLSYWAWGDEANPPLVLVHGMRDHARAWDRVAEAFERDYYVVALDLRGHGDSQWSTGAHYGWTEFMLDLVALIDEVGGRASVVGHSVGGGIALFAAGVFPERFAHLVSIEGVNPWLHGDRPPGPERMREWAERAQEERPPRVYAGFDAALARLREVNPRLDPPLAEHLTREGTRPAGDGEPAGGLVWKYDPWLLTQHGLDVRTEEFPRYWAAIECPVLHIVGDTSPLRRATFAGRPLDEHFADARTLRVADAGHWVHHDRLEETVTAVRLFLATDGGEAARGR